MLNPSNQKYTIYKDSWKLLEIKKLETLAEESADKINKHWEECTDVEKECMKEIYRLIRNWVNKKNLQIRDLKKSYKKEKSNKGKIIHVAFESFKNEHGHPYKGKYFLHSFFKDKNPPIYKYLNEEEKEIIFKNDIEYEYYHAAESFKNKHIALSLLRNKKIHQIIPNCRCWIDFFRIKKEIEDITTQICKDYSFTQPEKIS